MREPDVELALGTVQFGIAYGVSGRGSVVPEREVHQILEKAWEWGVRMLDTAPGYGDIEERLGRLAGDHPFEIVSKVPALPRGMPSHAIANFVSESIGQSRLRLGRRLRTILFHRGDDLLEHHATVAWRAANDACFESDVAIGASFYSPDAASAVSAQFPLSAVQVPGNALDQRLMNEKAVTSLCNMEIHLRSVFLQGLLLLPLEQAVVRVPKATRALEIWRHACATRGIDPLRAALGFAKALPSVRFCVVGVDCVAQLEEIVDAWQNCSSADAPSIAGVQDEDVIDPRRWNTA